MELLADYGSDDEETTPKLDIKVMRAPINSRPDVLTSQEISFYNNPYGTTLTKVESAIDIPERPSYRKIVTGKFESTHVEDAAFEEQYKTFSNYGYAHDPAGNTNILGDANALYENENMSNTQKKEGIRATKRRKLHGGEASDVAGFMGPWAPLVEEEEWRKTHAEKGIMTEEQKKYKAEHDARVKKAKDAAADPEAAEKERELTEEEERRKEQESQMAACKSTWHGDALVDYQGRSWITPPSDLKTPDEDHKCFIPKKLEHKFVGHSKGVQAIRFFPKFGHLLLSGSLDSKVKIWDVFNSRKCQRTYLGHSAAVRDINFNNIGDAFLSASFDRTVKLWDTETGACTGSFSNGKMIYCATFHPHNNNVFLCGSSNKRIVQFDARSGKITQQYDHHLGAVNSVTFVDEGRRFVSTSDDKKVLIWEFDIPVPIKYISDPEMHSMPSVTLSPNGSVFAGQSMDNCIKCYTARDKYKLLQNKIFKGHANAGFACQVGFSTDSKFIMSGDGEGKLWFWDYQTKRVLRKINAHEKGPCMGAIWHPIEASKVATCGWDGQIKLWD